MGPFTNIDIYKPGQGKIPQKEIPQKMICSTQYSWKVANLIFCILK